jgi:hypothetical protein
VAALHGGRDACTRGAQRFAVGNRRVDGSKIEAEVGGGPKSARKSKRNAPEHPVVKQGKVFAALQRKRFEAIRRQTQFSGKQGKPLVDA